MDELCLSVELKAVGDPDSSLPDLPVLLSVEADGVASLEGLPLADEAYELRIIDLGVSIRASHAHGLFNGTISLMQLLPACAPMSGDIQLDCIEVWPCMQAINLSLYIHFSRFADPKMLLLQTSFQLMFAEGNDGVQEAEEAKNG